MILSAQLYYIVSDIDLEGNRTLRGMLTRTLPEPTGELDGISTQKELYEYLLDYDLQATERALAYVKFGTFLSWRCMGSC